MATKTAASKSAPKATPAPVAPNPYCADGCGSRVNSPKSTFIQGHDQRLISDLSFRVVDGEMGGFQRALLGLVDSPKTTAADEFYYNESGDIMDRINTISAAVTRVFSAALSAKFTSAAMAKWDKAVARTATAERRAQAKAAKAAKAAAESPATKAVFRRLSHGVGSTHEPVGSTFSLDDPAEFERQAKAYLSDQTNLKSATIDKADWTQVYSYFAAGLVTPEPTPAKITGADKKTVGQPIQNLRGTEVKVKIGRWTYDAVVTGMNQAGKITAVEYANKKGDSVTTDRFTLVK